MSWIGILIFALTYVLISARRLSWLGLDRPSGALFGAVAVVAFGVLSPTEALAAVDGATLLLLFGVMGMGAFLALDGFFDGAADFLVRKTRRPRPLLGAIVWGAGLLSAFITNDAVCVLGAPLVIGLIRKHDLPALPFLLALATAANTGSAATLVGNPQNMLCGILGDLSYRDHLLLVGPLALLCLGLNHLLLLWIFRRQLDDKPLTADAKTPPRLSARVWISLGVIAGSAVAYTLGLNLAWVAAGGFVILLLVQRRDPRQLWARIDWSLLLFFAGLFIVVRGLVHTGAPDWLFAQGPLRFELQGFHDWMRLSGIFLLGSNVVSNVPFILVVAEQMAKLPDPNRAWELLSVLSTFAGNLTLLGSVANIIVAEQARDLGGIGFWQHLKIGLPLTLLTSTLGALWLWIF